MAGDILGPRLGTEFPDAQSLARFFDTGGFSSTAPLRETPEPGTLLLLASAFGGLAVLRKRRAATIAEPDPAARGEPM